MLLTITASPPYDGRPWGQLRQSGVYMYIQTGTSPVRFHSGGAALEMKGSVNTQLLLR